MNTVWYDFGNKPNPMVAVFVVETTLICDSRGLKPQRNSSQFMYWHCDAKVVVNPCIDLFISSFITAVALQSSARFCGFNYKQNQQSVLMAVITFVWEEEEWQIFFIAYEILCLGMGGFVEWYILNTPSITGCIIAWPFQSSKDYHFYRFQSALSDQFVKIFELFLQPI